MGNDKKENHWSQLYIAGITALAALAGSLITGNRMIEAQRIQNEQALKVMSGTNSQIELSIIREKCADYFILLQDVLLTANKKKDKIDEKLQLLNNKGYELIFYVRPELVSSTLYLNQITPKVVNSVGKEDFDKNKKEFYDALGKWFSDYIKEVNHYRQHTVPTESEDELIQLVYKMLSKEKME